MDKEQKLKEIIEDFKKIEEVKAISFAGSSSSGRNDVLSDIDMDIFTEKSISIEAREKIISKYASYKEVGNDYWGEGDEFILKELDVPVDIAYFDINCIEDTLCDILDKHIANIGYTTCFWYNVKNCKIVFDRDGKLKSLQDKCNCNYPVELKENIIKKNYPLLIKNMSSYYNQIKKAIKRGDLNSVNHRLAGFFASYFDIIFAINEIPHPGEKRLVNIVERECSIVPNNFRDNINEVFRKSGTLDITLLDDISNIIDELRKVLI